MTGDRETRRVSGTTCAVPYRDRILEIEIPSRNLLFEVDPSNTGGHADPRAAVRSALQAPVGSRPLRELLTGREQVVLVSDDNTRRTPSWIIVPEVLDELNRAGVPDSSIRIVISSGTHRPMTEGEILGKYGKDVIRRVPILPHGYKDPSELVAFGTTRHGTPILVNREVVSADVRIAIGEIVPHHPAGWGGGAKAVLPGVAGEETVARLHLLGSRFPGLGAVETVMRREMEDFAEKIGLNFIVNAVLNRQGDLVDVACGDFIRAHRAGVEISRRIYGAEIPERADLTVSSTSPVDFDFFQGDKGITSAELATREGGEILLVSGCDEGISRAHPELADYLGQMTADEIWDLVQRGPVPDRLTCAEAIVIANIAAKMKIALVTDGISPELSARMGFGHCRPGELQRFVERRIAAQPDLKVGILRSSAELLPIVVSH